MGINPMLKVVGKCPKCAREVTREAPRGRVTWRGPCPAKDCDGRIIARKADAPDGKPPAAPAKTSTDTKPKKGAVPRVGYDKPAEGGRPPVVQEPGGQPAGDPPAGGQQPPPPPAVPAAGRPDPAGGDQPARKRRRWGWEHPYSHLGY